MDAAPAVAPYAANEAKQLNQPPASAAAAPNENGVQTTAAKKSETATGIAIGTGTGSSGTYERNSSVMGVYTR